METVKKYIDFSENKELWREVDKMTGLGMKIGEECYSQGWDEGRQSGIEAGEEREKRSVAFRLFERNQSLEDVSSIIDRPMEYTMELRQEYERKVHEDSKYGEK